MSKKTVIGTAVVALLVGIGLGNTPAGSTEKEVAEPKIRTVTETQTVTEEVVPQGCLDAIDAAETMATQSGKFARITVGYIDLIERAAMAGASFDTAEVADIAHDMEDLSGRTNNITERLDPVIASFKSGRAECEAAAF